MRARLLVLVLVMAAALSAACTAAHAQLRIVSLNGSNSTAADASPRNPWMSTILSAIGSSVSKDPFSATDTGIAKPIDVLALQEVYSAATTSAGYAATLNALYPGANYQYATLNGATSGTIGGTQGLVYNANAVTLIGQATVGTVSSSGQPRQGLRYQLRPVGYGADADVYLYNSHYKANLGDEARRQVEAQATRADAESLGSEKNIIYLGDFNVYDASEQMYATLTASGSAQAVDPINRTGAWHDNSSYRRAHTQSPFDAATATALGTNFSGAGGGMDDRFDFQLVSRQLNDGNGIAYIAGSYQAFGNNGTHAFNGPVNSAGNTAQPKSVLDALAATMDHLPVVADYQLPAKLQLTVAPAPAQVIRDGSVTVGATVANVAPVAFANGADALDYALTGSGAATGGASGSNLRVGSPASHAIALDTATVGPRAGQITATSSNEQVVGNNAQQAVSYTVLDSARPSFTDAPGQAADQTAATADFGYVPVNSAARAIAFQVRNRVGTAGYSAALDVDFVTSVGDTARLTTTAAPFSNLAAGSGASFNAQLSTSAAGNFTATHTFATSDQNLPGAAARSDLVLTSTARVFSAASFPVTGYLFLPSNEPLATGPFSVAAGVTLTRTGPGAMTVSGAQSHAAGAQLVLSGGATTFSTDAGTAGAGGATLGLTVNAGAIATFAATQHVASLTINTGGVATVASQGGRAIVTESLAISGTGALDLRDNDAIVRNGSPGAWDGSGYTGITALVRSGLANAAWSGKGIGTSQPQPSPGVIMRLGVATAQQVGAAGGTWNGRAVAAGDVLVAYTYAGDADLDGRIDGDDYFRIDSHVATATPGWFNGDFDYNGRVNGDDYFAIDFNFAGQLARPGGSAAVAGAVAIPEPASLAPLAALAAALLKAGRRGRGGAAGI
ncbi:MAG TPA: endonuclease/exonuclease/phosphatase family protein [Tepidisphaeraceae bacterium]|nr:endonuclease/exonuclease/phosphatase family protein [Tepidisphaeraceae bacterium]